MWNKTGTRTRRDAGGGVKTSELAAGGGDACAGAPAGVLSEMKWACVESYLMISSGVPKVLIRAGKRAGEYKSVGCPGPRRGLSEQVSRLTRVHQLWISAWCVRRRSDVPRRNTLDLYWFFPPFSVVVTCWMHSDRCTKTHRLRPEEAAGIC